VARSVGPQSFDQKSDISSAEYICDSLFNATRHRFNETKLSDLILVEQQEGESAMGEF